MIKNLFELVTGTPWTTGRSASADFGPTIAARYAAELGALTDEELLRLTPAQAIAYAEGVRALRAKSREAAPIPEHV